MQQRLPRAPVSPALLPLVLFGLASPWAAQQPAYSVERVPLPAGRKAFAAMNDRGAIGVSITLADGPAVFRYADGVLERLPDPPGATLSGPRLVMGIDSEGNVIGRYRTEGGERAVRWTAQDAEPLLLPADGEASRVAVAPDGTVAISGYPFRSWDPAWEDENGWDAELPYLAHRDPMQCYVLRDGTPEPLPAGLAAGMLAGGMTVNGINDAGQVALTVYVDHEARAYLFDPRDGLRALPSLGGTLFGPYAISARGAVVGVIRFDGRSRPVLWRRGRAEELPRLPGHVEAYATDLNDREEIVGYGLSSSGQLIPVVWLRGRPWNLVDFLPPGSDASLQRPFAMNERGQILVGGQIGSSYELFLFTPSGPFASPGGDLR